MAKFCENCGASLMTDTAKFCSSCGKAIPSIPQNDQPKPIQQPAPPMQPVQPQHQQPHASPLPPPPMVKPVSPAQPIQPQYQQQYASKPTPSITPWNQTKNAFTKQIKKSPAFGMIMLILGALSFVGGLIARSLIEEPLVYNYSIYGDAYETALQEYQVLRAVASVGIFVFFVIMLIGGCIVFVNRNKAKNHTINQGGQSRG